MNEISKNRINTIDVAKLQTYLNAMGMANNLTKGEFEQFVEIAQGFGLNPFKREIYANKYGDKYANTFNNPNVNNYTYSNIN